MQAPSEVSDEKFAPTAAPRSAAMKQTMCVKQIQCSRVKQYVPMLKRTAYSCSKSFPLVFHISAIS